MKFTPSHEWISVTDNVGTIGISRWAQKELGEIVYVELPRVGHQVHLGDEVAVLESTKAAADVYTPVSGVILEVNERLKEEIALLNVSPEKEGWLFKIQLTHPDELNKLMPENVYHDLVSS